MSFLFKNILVATVLFAFGQNLNVRTVSEWNEQIPVWGSAWAPDSKSNINGYQPSFYTGFAPRSQMPDRIHIRTSRGNQTRVSVILDEQTVKDYVFDLAKRAKMYQELSSAPQGKRAVVNIETKNGKFLPQLSYFLDIIKSPEYKIQEVVNASLKDGSYDSAAFYSQAMQIMEKLNPGRIFWVRLDLKKEFSSWQVRMKALLNNQDAKNILTADSKATVIALDSLVWGRVNYTQNPSAEVLAQLAATANLAQTATKEDPAFIAEAYKLFVLLSGDKYAIKTLDSNGQWVSALNCTASVCELNYPEFTTVYPTGSAKSFKNDKFGNRIPNFASPGLWTFIDYSGPKEVDNIRDEPYYGWAPKLDFENIGNGFHNPAVRFRGDQLSKSVREILKIDKDYSQFWGVHRGGVSHGCLRLALGHIWELRHILPVQNDKMVEVHFFGSSSDDFDLYDIDGDGALEVMGVEYQVSYDFSEKDRREGKNLDVSSEGKNNYYEKLYGKKNVFSAVGDRFEFLDPSVSLPSYLDYNRKKVATSLVMPGNYPLYEQTYEQDKVQMYIPYTMEGLTTNGAQPLSKRIARIMGRVRGCSPSSDKDACGENAYDNEINGILKEIYK